jgi:membrane dipeptidase
MSDAALERAVRVLSRHPVIDGHNDLAWAMRKLCNYDFDRADPTGPLPATHTDLPRLRAGHVGGQFWSVFVPTSFAGGAAVSATLEQIDFVRRFVARAPADLTLCTSAAELSRAIDTGRIGGLLAMEGGHCIDDSLAVLRQLAALGVRSMTLTHNDNTSWADSATDQPRHGGLTDFGVEVVREMNRLGVLVDISHVAPATMHAALDASTAPVVFTHSSCRAVCEHPRNVPDDVLRRIPGNGGIVMVTFVPSFVNQACADWAAAGRDGPRPRAGIADVADHLDHARAMVGPDHLGLGGDYDGVDALPDGLADVSAYPRLFAELVRRGWDDDELAALACRNLLRVLRAAESAA